MTVIMKGGNSGNRESALPPVPTTDGEYSYPAQGASLSPGVDMDGANSGNREDALPNVTVSYNHQVPQNTASNESYPDIQYSQNTGNRDVDASPQVPNCGSPDDSAV